MRRKDLKGPLEEAQGRAASGDSREQVGDSGTERQPAHGAPGPQPCEDLGLCSE